MILLLFINVEYIKNTYIIFRLKIKACYQIITKKINNLIMLLSCVFYKRLERFKFKILIIIQIKINKYFSRLLKPIMLIKY